MHYFSLNCTPLLYPILLLHVISYILPLLCFTYNFSLPDNIWSTVYFIPSCPILFSFDLSWFVLYIFFLPAVADYALSTHQTECTSSCPISEVKQRWVSLVLGWVTTSEQHVFVITLFNDLRIRLIVSCSFTYCIMLCSILPLTSLSYFLPCLTYACALP